MKKLSSFLEGLYWWLKDNWLASVLFYLIPSTIISATKLIGNYIGLIDPATGALTNFGIVVVVLSFSFILAYSIVKEYADYTFFQASKKGQQILAKMLESVNNVISRKSSKYIEFIDSNSISSQQNPFSSLIEPKEQIREILIEMQKTFTELFGISETEIGFSLVCKLRNDNDWLVPASINVSSVEKIKEMLNDKNSAFQPIITGKKIINLIPDKRDAVHRGEYRAGQKDFASNSVGSIICVSVNVTGNERYVQGILSISTYGQFLFPEDSPESEKKVKDQILPAYIKRLQIELALLFVKEVMDSQTS